MHVGHWFTFFSSSRAEILAMELPKKVILSSRAGVAEKCAVSIYKYIANRA
jgi:hypothetical protein